MPPARTRVPARLTQDGRLGCAPAWECVGRRGGVVVEGTERYPQEWYCYGMRATIDNAGRLVIPKSLREQSGLTPGEVEISLDGAAIRIESVAADYLVEEDGLLMLPSGGPELDADAVRELRLADQR
jgi:hypothetical protein